MEKIRLELRTLPTGAPQRSICRMASGKYMPLPKSLKIPDSLLGSEGEAEFESGVPVRIKIREKVYENEKMAEQQAAAPEKKMKPLAGVTKSAHPKDTAKHKPSEKVAPAPPAAAFAADGSYVGAPYNFIPLNGTVVSADGFVRGNQYHRSRLTGHIELKITTKTPLYIRGLSENPEIQNKDIQDFFAPGGRLAIPGSSLRGMVRTLLEIASYGTFSCDERKLYYRSLGDAMYRDQMVDMAHNCRPRVQAGYLRKQGNKYYIAPCRRLEETQYYRVNGRFVEGEFRARGIGGAEISVGIFQHKKVWFVPAPVVPNPHNDDKKRVFQLDYALIKPSDIDAKPFENSVEGCLVATGGFGNRKHMQWLLNLPDDNAQEILLPKQVVLEYRADAGRDEKADLLEACKGKGNVPCFYLTHADGTIRAIGHTAMFRLPYEKSIRSHLPQRFRTGTSDYAQALFGKLEKWGSRLFFEDAWLDEGQKDLFMNAVSPKILSTPKPTTYQHYLEQPHGKKTSRHNVQNWNGSTDLRGYKLYWHRDTGTDQWSEGRVIKDKQHTVIKAVNKGKCFTGRIYFENLSKVELGAVLFVLALPEGCCHKLGMGKPLGLGSISISSALVLDNRATRYRSLFSGLNWQSATDDQGPSAQDCIKIFETTIMNALSRLDKLVDPGTQQVAGSLWETARMRMLKAMLDWQHTENIDEWNEMTRYMVNEYQKRAVLPNPLHVVTG